MVILWTSPRASSPLPFSSLGLRMTEESEGNIEKGFLLDPAVGRLGFVPVWTLVIGIWSLFVSCILDAWDLFLVSVVPPM